MSFSIIFIDDPVPPGLLRSGEEASFAEIEIGDFKERLLVPFDNWKAQDYIRNWKSELDDFLNRSSSIAVLVVEMYNPDYANFIKCWTLYREGDQVAVVNNVIFLEDIKEPLSANTLHDYVDKERLEYTEEGDKVSSWYTTENEISRWRQGLK